MVVPVYNAELAPKTIRGRLVSLYQLAITAGIMVRKEMEWASGYCWSDVIGEFSYQPCLQRGAGGLEDISRHASCAGCNICTRDALVTTFTKVWQCGASMWHLICWFGCRWLAMKGRHAKVLVVLTRIRCCTEQQVQEEFDEIKSSVNSVSVKGGMLESLRLLIRWRLFHRQVVWNLVVYCVLSCRLLIGVWLQLFQQFIGMNVIMWVRELRG